MSIFSTITGLLLPSLCPFLMRLLALSSSLEEVEVVVMMILTGKLPWGTSTEYILPVYPLRGVVEYFIKTATKIFHDFSLLLR